MLMLIIYTIKVQELSSTGVYAHLAESRLRVYWEYTCTVVLIHVHVHVIYVHVYMNVHNTCTCTYSIHMYIYMYIYMYTCTVYTYTCTYIYMYMCTHAYIYIIYMYCIHCVYTCIHTHVHMGTCTYICTFMPSKPSLHATVCMITHVISCAKVLSLKQCTIIIHIAIHKCTFVSVHILDSSPVWVADNNTGNVSLDSFGFLADGGALGVCVTVVLHWVLHGHLLLYEVGIHVGSVGLGGTPAGRRGSQLVQECEWLYSPELTRDTCTLHMYMSIIYNIHVHMYM